MVNGRLDGLVEELGSGQAFCSVSISLVLVPPVCCGAFQEDQASRASPVTACRVPCLLDSPLRCGALVPIRIGVHSVGFLSQVQPEEAALFVPWRGAVVLLLPRGEGCAVLLYQSAFIRVMVSQ